ncbi:MAG: CorA family divalent cation transporter [Verrucomicrobiota bacterium]|nr:CorA family divalent cation transporter [Verrucomicrobiota bacterium]
MGSFWINLINPGLSFAKWLLLVTVLTVIVLGATGYLNVVKDELATALSDRTNKNLYILSVIAAIFLPLGFLTGMMGVNIGGMPGVESDNAFWIFGGFLAIVTGIQVLIFEWLKWF